MFSRILSHLVALPLFATLLLVCPAAIAQGLSLDALMEEDPLQQNPSPPAPESASQPGDALGFDDIYAGREQARQQRTVDALRDFDRRLASRCACSNSGCVNFEDRRISQPTVVEAGKKAASQLNGQILDTCGKWRSGRNLAATDAASLAQQLQFARDVEGVLDQLDNSANTVRQNLISKDNEISRAVAQQQQSKSSFDWGKAMALGVGALAGGLDQLSSDAQAQILSAIVADSYGGADGISNLQSTVNSLSIPSAGALSGVAAGGASGGSGGGFVVDEQFQFSCPHGGNHSVPIKAKSTACAQAMRHYAKTAGCNLIDDMQSAQDNYYATCASEMYE